MKLFAQKRTSSSQIFPHPTDGELILETPPCLVWLKEPDNDGKGYTVRIEGENGFFGEYHSEKSYFCPPDVLPSGNYKWNVFAGDSQNGEKHFTIAENAVTFIRPTPDEIYDAVDESVHPRALFFAEDVPDILKNHEKDIEVLRRNIAAAKSDGVPKTPYADEFNEKNGNEVRFLSRLYMNYIRDYVDTNLVALALGWRLLGDRQAAEAGKRTLLELSSWEHERDELSILGKKSDEVGLSMARCLPVAYDLLYDVLTHDERESVLRVISIVAAQSYEKIVDGDYEGNPGNSHSGRVPAYLGMMAIMLKGYEKRETVLKYLQVVCDIYGGLFPHYGSEDGGWGEGVFYASSYTKWYLPYFVAVERLTGKSYLDRPFYQNVSNFFLHFADRDLENHPFGDGYWCKSEDEEWPGFFAQNPYRVYAERFGPIEAQRKEREIPPPERFRLHLLDVFLPTQKKPKHHITKAASLAHAFDKTGYFSMRSSFDTRDCMAVMARASRFGSASHSHSDQGSFALFYEGTSLISPSGYYGWGWGTRHHKEWTNTSRAHNTITINGEGQPTFSEKPTGRVEYCRREGDIFLAALDLDDSYDSLTSWKRTFTMDARAKTLIVEDEICAEEDVNVDWHLHSLSRPQEKDGRVCIERNGIALKIEVLCGLHPTPTLSDEFAVDLNAGVSPSQITQMPEQFHVRYSSASSKSHKIKVKFTIEK